ncbi:MAG: D-alanine--D-alanine ligase, partial [Acidimicrobiaceae bacterium]|nr:D-alanine--D-alanine ligase [Acidimicrobiaceae bacterium]
MSGDNRASKTHIFVLFGGESAEHDVSCVTAAHVVRALNPERYLVTTIGITRAGDWVLADSPQESSPINPGSVSIPDRLTAHGTPTTIAPILQSAHNYARTVVI